MNLSGPGFVRAARLGAAVIAALALAYLYFTGKLG